MTTVYEKSSNTNIVNVNPFYKEMYYAPLQKLEETKSEKGKQQVFWNHMMNMSVQNSVSQALLRAKAA